jgi:hypothetical protein
MWSDLTRGFAALKSVWSVASTEAPADSAPITISYPTGDFLGEAENYIHMGRHHSAAILAGDALEATLQQLCHEYRVPLPVNNSQVEQRLAELQTIWEKANCGLWSEVSKSDVETMLGEIRAFVSEHIVY